MNTRTLIVLCPVEVKMIKEDSDKEHICMVKCPSPETAYKAYNNSGGLEFKQEEKALNYILEKIG